MRITTIGDPVLRRRTPELDLDELGSPEVQALIDGLIEARREAGGAGLAAPQVSVPVRIAVVEVDEATRRRYPYKPAVPLAVLVNPVLEPLSDEMLVINEGCLSVPGLRGDVPRHATVQAKYFDRNGAQREVVVEGLSAGTFQHEVDHLDGILFVDRADPRSLSTWEQFERHGQAEFLDRIRGYGA